MTELPDDTGGAGRSDSSDPASLSDAPTVPWRQSDPAWPVEATETLFETPWVDAGREVVRRSTGETATYDWARQEPAVAVVAHDREADELVLVEQYRPRFRRRFVSCTVGHTC